MAYQTKTLWGSGRREVQQGVFQTSSFERRAKGAANRVEEEERERRRRREIVSRAFAAAAKEREGAERAKRGLEVSVLSLIVRQCECVKRRWWEIERWCLSVPF